MRGGPVRAYTFGVTLQPTEGGGTALTVTLDLEPRHWLLRPIVEQQARRFVKGMAELTDQIDAHLREWCRGRGAAKALERRRPCCAARVLR
jgi:hypothetical protein